MFICTPLFKVLYTGFLPGVGVGKSFAEMMPLIMHTTLLEDYATTSLLGGDPMQCHSVSKPTLYFLYGKHFCCCILYS